MAIVMKDAPYRSPASLLNFTTKVLDDRIYGDVVGVNVTFELSRFTYPAPVLC